MEARRIENVLRVIAGILLALAIVLPIYSLPISWTGDTRAVYAWNLSGDDARTGVLFAVAFLGPASVIGAHGLRLSRAGSILFALAQIAVLGVSAMILLAVMHSAFTLLPNLSPWLLVPASGSTGAGLWLALSADVALLLMWSFSLGWRLRGETARTPKPAQA
jgi:hypothetical protein